MPSSRRTLRELGYYDPPPRWPRLRMAFFSAAFGTLLGAAGVIALGSPPDRNADSGSRVSAPETGRAVRAEAAPDLTDGSNASVPRIVDNDVPNGEAGKPPAKPPAKPPDKPANGGVAETPAKLGGAAPVAAIETAPATTGVTAAHVPQASSSEAAPDHKAAAQPPVAPRKRPRKIVQAPNRSGNDGDDVSSSREERTERWTGRGYAGYAGQDRQDRRRGEAGMDGRWREERADRWDGRGFTAYASQERRRDEADDDSPWRGERADRWDARSWYAGQDRRRSEAGDDGRWRDKRPRGGRSRASAGEDEEGRGGFGRDAADARERSHGSRGLWFW
jgi:hypothetical protein